MYTMGNTGENVQKTRNINKKEYSSKDGKKKSG